MSELAKPSSRKTTAKKGDFAPKAKKPDLSSTKNSPVDQVLNFQRVVGNHTVQDLFKAGVLQPKLKIGEPGDKYELEADTMADQVMRMPDSVCPSCMEKKEELIQPKGENSATAEVSPGIESGINLLKGGGQTLPESVRNYFEPRFGYDFSGVRVHTGVEANETAKSINARAFTLGKDIVFSGGQYAQETTQGQKLLAHELVHIIQQSEDEKVSQTLQRTLNCGEEALCLRDPEGYPLIYQAGEGKNYRNCRYAVGYAQKLLNLFFQSGGIDQCEQLHNNLRIQRGQALPQDATRMFYINSGKANTPLSQHCWFDTATRAVTLGFQAAVFENPNEWDGKIGDRTWSALEDFETEHQGKNNCPFRLESSKPLTNALKIRALSPPAPGPCGNVNWETMWELIKPSKLGGHIVQHVFKLNQIWDPNGKDITDSKARRVWDYYEAWKVDPGTTVGVRSSPLLRHDAFWCTSMGPGTSGDVTIEGTASFYEGQNTLPADFILNNPDTLAGDLPSSVNNPNFTGGTYPIDHELSIRWDCSDKVELTEVYHHIP
jgi:hypothetical protein